MLPEVAEMTEVRLVLRTAIFLLFASLRLGLALKLTGNVAKSCKVDQSSVWNDDTVNYLPKFAVDGSHPDSNAYCSCTKTETSPWLRVTLPHTYVVAKIVISYPKDCCEHTLNGAEIRVGNSLANNGNDNTMVATMDTSKIAANLRKAEYLFTPVVGRYVNVYLPNKSIYLIVCEVEVYALSEEELQLQKKNLALMGRATQSSLFQDSWSAFGLALNAVDGNRNSDLYKGSCSHTHEEKDPWWRIDLLDERVIASVSLTNRGDCCHERLNGAVIHIGDSLTSEGQSNPVCAVVTTIPAGQTKSFECANAMWGRYVTIVVPGEKRILALCEVEVIGF